MCNVVGVESGTQKGKGLSNPTGFDENRRRSSTNSARNVGIFLCPRGMARIVGRRPRVTQGTSIKVKNVSGSGLNAQRKGGGEFTLTVIPPKISTVTRNEPGSEARERGEKHWSLAVNPQEKKKWIDHRHKAPGEPEIVDPGISGGGTGLSKNPKGTHICEKVRGGKVEALWQIKEGRASQTSNDQGLCRERWVGARRRYCLNPPAMLSLLRRKQDEIGKKDWEGRGRSSKKERGYPRSPLGPVAGKSREQETSSLKKKLKVPIKLSVVVHILSLGKSRSGLTQRTYILLRGMSNRAKIHDGGVRAWL